MSELRNKWNSGLVQGSSGSMLQSKSVSAMRNVIGLCTNSGSLVRTVRGEDPDVDVSSCYATMFVLHNNISNTQSQYYNIGIKQQDVIITDINQLLTGPHAVFISVKPDHHFTVLSVDSGQIKILQGFQGVYNLVEWYTNRGTETMQQFMFIQHMNDLVSPDAATRVAAAIALFSYDSPGGKINDEIEKWFCRLTRITSLSYKVLNGA
jgi:hypothetical protein